jgi:hypothetical protein
MSRGVKGVIVLWPHCMKYLLSEWSMMTPFIFLLIVTSLYEVFIGWMEYDDTFHTSAHCDLTDWNSYWVKGVWWHLSYLCSLWSHCIKYLLTEWREVTMRRNMKGVIILHSLNKYFIQWGHNEKRYERCHHTPLTKYILQSVRSQWAEVWKVSSYSIHSINTSYSDVRMSRGVKGVIVLHSLNKYLIQWGHNEQSYERCHHTPLTQYILQSVRSQWAEVWKMSSYSIHSTSAHCDLTDWSIYWVNGVWWHLS